MDKMVFFVSDCCYAESDKDIAVCSRCGEHCDIITDDSLVSDEVLSNDNGEW